MGSKQRVFSGIRATGQLHLGNYYGAIKGMLALQDEHETIYSVVDLHSITTPVDYASMPQNIRGIAIDYLAAGLDPNKSILMVQSQNPAHLELAWILGAFVPVAWLSHLPTYKEKRKQHPDFVNWGLLSYPVLMAADILAYKAPLVPIGKDQEPHLELTREIARKFNREFDYDFPEPQSFATQGYSLPTLMGDAKKMSKSVEGSFIALSDDFETIKKKLAKAPTDAGNEADWSRGTQNLFALMELFSEPDVVVQFKEQRVEGSIRYGDFKQQLAKDIYAELAPIQERRRELEAKPAYIDEVLAEGAERARKISDPILREVKDLVGLR
jgi:tryptophanyl-tRNA synthetase